MLAHSLSVCVLLATDLRRKAKKMDHLVRPVTRPALLLYTASAIGSASRVAFALIAAIWYRWVYHGCQHYSTSQATYQFIPRDRADSSQ